MIGYGCQSKSEQNKIVSEYSSLILDHVFLSEDFSLPPYYELKGKGGKVYRVDSIFNSLKLVIRFSELNCEKCYTEELERIMESGLSQYAVGIASFSNMRVLELIRRKLGLPFPIYYISFTDERELFPESLQKMRTPYVFLMDERCKSRYLFFPSLNHSKVSSEYYKKVYSMLMNANKNDIEIFEEKSIDLGKITLGKPYEAFFKYKNNSDGYLVIDDIKVSCGCTQPNWEKRPLGKGDSAKLCVTFIPNTIGYNLKTLMVRHNKSKYPVKLFIRADVVEH